MSETTAPSALICAVDPAGNLSAKDVIGDKKMRRAQEKFLEAMQKVPHAKYVWKPEKALAADQETLR